LGLEVVHAGLGPLAHNPRRCLFILRGAEGSSAVDPSGGRQAGEMCVVFAREGRCGAHARGRALPVIEMNENASDAWRLSCAAMEGCCMGSDDCAWAAHAVDDGQPMLRSFSRRRVMQNIDDRQRGARRRS
jgi:hypothetical protein